MWVQSLSQEDPLEKETETHSSILTWKIPWIFSSKMFWIVALMCVLYYSAIFPFQRYAPNYLESTLGIDAGTAAHLFSFFPILAMILTPFLGGFISFKGKAASMLLIGSLIMVACHLSFALLLPAFPSKWLAVTLILTGMRGLTRN